ncbi:MAG: hypothetical protein ACE5DM_01530 [Candidatus Nanoarchaeia archaeon]
MKKQNDMIAGPDKWCRAIASIQLDRFNDKFSKERVDVLLEKLRLNNMKVLSFIEPNLIVFEKKECDFAQAGKQIEEWLLKNFSVKRKNRS